MRSTKRGKGKNRMKKAKHGWTPLERAVLWDRTGIEDIDNRDVWMNNKYTVLVRMVDFDGVPGMMAHLSIKRNDKRHTRDWRDLQRIKNELCGTLCEGAELFPKEGRNIDMANQYHMWVLSPRHNYPFGFNSGRFVSSDPDTKKLMNKTWESLQGNTAPKAKQRKFLSHHGIEGCPAIGPVWADLFSETEREESNKEDEQ
jgi:hypothetical protein